MRRKDTYKQNVTSLVIISNYNKVKKLRIPGKQVHSQKHYMHMQPRLDVIALELVGDITPEINHFSKRFLIKERTYGQS